MDMCSLDTHENFSDMRKKAVKCIDGKTVGHITDVVFDKDMNIHSFILGGQLWDKIRKRFGFVHNIEYTITADKINEIVKNNIRLMVSKKQLKENIQEGVILSSTPTYTSLRRKVVVDLDKKLIGKIINMVFLPCGEAAFIVSCLKPETVGIPKGLGSKWDLLVPVNDIESVTDNHIFLNVRVDALEKTLNHHILNREAANKYLNSLKEKNVVEKRALVRVYDGFHMK